MHITLIQVGKTDESYLQEGIGKYLRRINRYVKFDVVTLPDVKGAKLTREKQKAQEGETILSRIADGDILVLLDESGCEFSSLEYAGWLQKKMNAGTRRLCFAIGGPYGFSREVYARSNEMISLSRMTFSHQLVRLVFAEQLYRAFTILNNEPYHHP